MQALKRQLTSYIKINGIPLPVVLLTCPDYRLVNINHWWCHKEFQVRCFFFLSLPPWCKCKHFSGQCRTGQEDYESKVFLQNMYKLLMSAPPGSQTHSNILKICQIISASYLSTLTTKEYYLTSYSTLPNVKGKCETLVRLWFCIYGNLKQGDRGIFKEKAMYASSMNLNIYFTSLISWSKTKI